VIDVMCRAQLPARAPAGLSLRLFHVSNADGRQPNPGETFLQLRYAAMF